VFIVDLTQTRKAEIQKLKTTPMSSTLAKRIKDTPREICKDFFSDKPTTNPAGKSVKSTAN
jgi:hypothetical protein